MVQVDLLLALLICFYHVSDLAVLAFDDRVLLLKRLDQVPELVELVAVFVLEQFLPLLHDFLIKLFVSEPQPVLELAHLLVVVAVHDIELLAIGLKYFFLILHKTQLAPRQSKPIVSSDIVDENLACAHV